MFYAYEVRSGAENMKIDVELLERKEPAFRLYGWSPMCVSVGRNQKDDFLKNDSRFTLHASRIDIVRRLTGGRALLHDDEITYSVVCPASKESVMESYKRISQVLVDAFARLGIELEFGNTRHCERSVGERKRPAEGIAIQSGLPRRRYAPPRNDRKNNCLLISTGADLCYRGKKLIGSAQFRKDGWILQHGSILYDYNPVLLEEIFGEPVGGEITCIKEIEPGLSKQEIIEMLQTCNMF